MAKFAYSVSEAGLAVPALVGLSGQETNSLVGKGLPVPPPILVRGLLDIGSTVCAISPRITRELGLAAGGSGSTFTAGGQVAVKLFAVSLSILPSTKKTPMLTLPQVWASELTVELPDTEVLIGLNVLLQCRLTLNGPRRSFSIQF